ncbi:hypothetical protein L7F22_026523 [Adiantum nelumboides]|nr:hypothetical protein [Adiantum nelumboides]
MATIHEAARAGDIVALLSFLDADALALNARDRHSRTPLHLASWAGHADVVHTLCKKHADVGAAAADNMSAIHFASQKGHTQVVRFLLAAGASVNASTRKGMTPIHYAIQAGHLDLAKLLIKRGASLYSVNKAGKKAIDFAKDDKYRMELQAAEASSPGLKSTEEKKEAEIALEAGMEHDFSMIENKEDHMEDPISQVDVSPPKKKTKVQLSHLGMEQ